jgi:nucleoside-diphosphate-sugar epimerase
VDDIINGLQAMRIRKEAVGEAINLGSGTEHQVAELATIVNRLTNNKVGIAHVPRRNWDVKTHRSSIDKARKLLDYQPQTKFEDGLKKVHKWFLENWDNIKRDAEF